MNFDPNQNADEFTNRQAGLISARAEANASRQALFLAREGLKQTETRLASLQRRFDPHNEADSAERERLESELKRASGRVKQLETAYSRLNEDLLGQWGEFIQFSDPRLGVSFLDDRYPFLLMPLRIETRFKALGEGPARQHQLWVRVYPDECMVDSFEAELSENEVSTGARFWVDYWRAGGFESQRRGAWATLVGSYGSGRSAWIVQNYFPLNKDDEPQKILETDIVLVIPCEILLDDSERLPLNDYWQAVWRSDGDPAPIADALETLEDKTSPARAQELIQAYVPANLDEQPAPPLQRSQVTVTVAYLQLPPNQELETKRQSWSQPARVHVLPDRFVLLGYSGDDKVLDVLGNPIPSPLVVSPDPTATEKPESEIEGETLNISPEMAWMVDFEDAIQKGMGFRVSLTADQYTRGFDRLIVLGLRLSADSEEARSMLETLFQHHQYSRSSFSLLPQGSATNNTEKTGSAFDILDDPESSFTDTFLKDELFTVQTGSWLGRADGQWLAELLGIDPETLKKVRHSDGQDQTDARAMNVALWPATLGYFLDTLLRPVLDNDAIEQTRWFFSNFVSGRGMIPAIRIGRQPYGILPVTAFSRMGWLDNDNWLPIQGLSHPKNFRGFLRSLNGILQRVEPEWQGLVGRAAWIGKGGDPHQVLLDILGLNPASVEYHRQIVESMDQPFNSLRMAGLDTGTLLSILFGFYIPQGMTMLNDLGYTGDEVPDILEKIFVDNPELLDGGVVDDVPLSEITGIREYTPDHRNYIAWLIDTARLSLEAVRLQQGFTDNKSPSALLYLLLRHSVLLGYWEAGIRLSLAAGVLENTTLKAVYQEPKFIHIATPLAAEGGVQAQATAAASESRWQMLYQASPQVTGNPSTLLGEFIPKALGRFEVRDLTTQLNGLDFLKDASTARLERALADHLDTVAYRLDAWKLGLVHYQLGAMRYGNAERNGEPQRGLYLGAFGWLEDVRAEDRQLTSAELSPELEEIFNPEGKLPPLMEDSNNQGFIHAPSLNHAVTAAILRNGYNANAGDENGETLAVNLSSERVRRALGVLEGIRNEQSLGALLGYQLERGLHDRSGGGIELDIYIYSLRKAFPLVPVDPPPPDDEALEAIAARNVVDGYALAEYIVDVDNMIYPFGRTDLLGASGPTLAAINAEVKRMMDLYDAVADLALAEGVHQAVQGNYERSAATLDAYSKSNFPQDPEVVRTPRSGRILTHRAALHLRSGLAHDPAANPRVAAAPALAEWVAGLLPAEGAVFCYVTYTGADGVVHTDQPVTQADLGLAPLDLLYMLRLESDQTMAELDSRITRHVIETMNIQPDQSPSIRYTARQAGLFSFFEISPQVNSLRSLLLRSRPLRAGDLALSNEATTRSEAAVFLDDQPVKDIWNRLDTLKTDLINFKDDLEALLVNVAVDREAALNRIDSALVDFAALFARSGLFGLPQSGFGFIYTWRRARFEALLGKVRELVDRWTDKEARFGEVMTAYNALPITATDEEKTTLLQQAELLISTAFSGIQPPATLKTHLETVKLLPFQAKKAAFQPLLAPPFITSLGGLRAAILAQLPVDAFDTQGLDLTIDEDEILRTLGSLALQAGNQATQIDQRWQAAKDLLDPILAPATSLAQVEALTQAAKLMLGEDTLIIPEFQMPAEQASEAQNAWDSLDELLSHQTVTLGVDFPVDEWLYGVARVREKLHHWENITFLSTALGRAAPDLHPLQIPYKTGDSWTALEYPSDYNLDSDRLLYTAAYVQDFDQFSRQCGLLLDEWTEMIPAQEEITGVTFHFDRPNTEPPQTMLLVTPANFTGRWSWDDLVDALHETLGLAKQRAIEPEFVDGTRYARLLPATWLPFTRFPISIALNLALNNRVFEFVSEATNA
jgi:hypothetical protein